MVAFLSTIAFSSINFVELPAAARAIEHDRSKGTVLIEEPSTLGVEVARIATIAEENFPSEFSYAGMSSSAESGYLVFRGAVPRGMEAEILGGSRIDLVSNAGFAMRELISYAAELSRSADAPTSGTISVLVSPRPMDRQFVVSIGRAELEDDAAALSGDAAALSIGDAQDIDRITGEIEDFVTEVPPPFSFTVEVEPNVQDLSRLEAEDGGRTLAGSCTGAFPVKSNQGPELGILTAGHCPGTGSYGGTANMFFPVVPYSLSTSNNSSTGGDFRWNHSRYSLSGFTYLGSGGSRKFASAANSVYGSGVCGYGKTTGHKCGSVWSVGSQATIYVPDGNANFTVGPLTCTANHVTQPGDSGGPWYLQNSSVATGIHSGYYNGSSCWSSVTNALRAFNLSFWTG